MKDFGADRTSAGGYLVSGGLDALIYVRDFPEASSAPSPAPRQTLSGHSGNVCSLHASSDGRRLVSGSWDATARVWDTRDWSCSQILVGHQAAVWDALAIEGKGYEDTVLTGALSLSSNEVGWPGADSSVEPPASADCLIRLFKGAECKVVFKGHTEAVRALAKVLPEDEDGSLFASASNDGFVASSPFQTMPLTPRFLTRTVRIWNLQGDAITTLEGHDSFIYTIVSLPSASGGGLASSGEEGIVKIWNGALFGPVQRFFQLILEEKTDEDGEEEQEILVPALSGTPPALFFSPASSFFPEIICTYPFFSAVWTLAALPNGDLAIGCSKDPSGDCLVWVFTRDEARGADAACIKVRDTSDWAPRSTAHFLPPLVGLRRANGAAAEACCESRSSPSGYGRRSHSAWHGR